MGYLTYVATEVGSIPKTGYTKTLSDVRVNSDVSDDSFNSSASSLSGLLTDQWVLAAGFTKTQNNGWFQVKANSTSAKILTLTPPVDHLRLPGTSGNYASTPDSAANSVTGDIDLRARVSSVDWTPGTAPALIAKWTSSGNHLAYMLRIETNGTLLFSWSPDGSAAAAVTVASTVGLNLVDGVEMWVRVTFDVNNGAGGSDAKFYQSSNGVDWVQVGATVTTAGVTSIFGSDAILEIGSSNVGTNSQFSGRVFYAEIRNGLNGPVVAAFDPARGTRGATTLVAATGETWTINSTGTPPAMLQGPRLIDEGAEWLALPGTSGNYASTPDSAANSVTGDIELMVKAALSDWTPSADSALIGKDDQTTNRDYQIGIQSGSTGKPYFIYTTDGSTTTGRVAVSTVAVPFVDGQTGWLRVTYASGTGVVKFFTSTDGVLFSQLGTNVTLTSGAIHDGTGQLRVGINNAGNNPMLGKVYYAEVRNGIGGPVAVVLDPHRALPGSTSLVSYTGETWTINQSGSPASELVRLTPVTLTGYVRGLGQQYTLEFGIRSADLDIATDREEQWPRDRSAPEVLVYGDDETITVQTSVIGEAALAQWREWRASTKGGETFIFDRYGTPSAPVEPRTAMVLSRSYRETREPGSVYPSMYSISFQVQLF